MRNFQNIFSRFMSILLILTGILLLMKWTQNANPDKGGFILIIALANLALGVVVYGATLWKRREALKAIAAQNEEGS